MKLIMQLHLKSQFSILISSIAAETFEVNLIKISGEVLFCK